MEICKFVKNEYPDMDSLITVINYVFNIEKTCGCIGAVSTCVHNCENEMYLVKKYFNKLDGQNLIHIVVWMPFFKDLAEDKLKELAFYLTLFFSNRYQAIFGVHFKGCGGSDSTHIHIVVNTVSFVDGYKLSVSYDLKAEFREFVRRTMKVFRKVNSLYSRNMHLNVFSAEAGTSLQFTKEEIFTGSASKT